jgi:two-component system phosphate regulon response regulator PhoB/two-component system alkaline phosphatase synthesis response regulator PhoP
MGKVIAIIEDEPDIVELVTVNLKRAGFTTYGFNTAEKFFSFLKTQTPDVIILDLMLPDIDGLDICKRLKKNDALAAIPIIMLTAKADETDKILGLELGADDYVTKPFSPKELVARVKVALRRLSPKEVTQKIEIGGILTIDTEKFEVKVTGDKIEVTSTEFKILQVLASKPGWVFSRDKILDYLWGKEKAVLDRTVDVHVKNLREKLGAAGQFIKNVRGIGYKLEV